MTPKALLPSAKQVLPPSTCPETRTNTNNSNNKSFLKATRDIFNGFLGVKEKFEDSSSSCSEDEGVEEMKNVVMRDNSDNDHDNDNESDGGERDVWGGVGCLMGSSGSGTTGKSLAIDVDEDVRVELDDIPGSPVTASPPESPKGIIDDDMEGMKSRRMRRRGGLVYQTSVVSIPHPEKADKGGEDAHFVDRMSIGVFDGVGGWASVGVDAGEYSRELAERVRGLTEVYGEERQVGRRRGGAGKDDVVEAVEKAVEDTAKTGSSTACVVKVEEMGRRISGVNLGDSGIMVVRDGRVVLKSGEQQHYFNCPYQLGTDSMDDVRAGYFIDWTIREGDWIVLATDGLWDNVFQREVVNAIVAESRSENESEDDDWKVEKVAQVLAKRALEVGLDTSAVSPFSVNAHDAGTLFVGGKLDDITVVVCKATEDEDLGFLPGEFDGHVVTRAMMSGRRFELTRKVAGGVKERFEREVMEKVEAIEDIRLS